MCPDLTTSARTIFAENHPRMTNKYVMSPSRIDFCRKDWIAAFGEKNLPEICNSMARVGWVARFHATQSETCRVQAREGSASGVSLHASSTYLHVHVDFTGIIAPSQKLSCSLIFIFRGVQSSPRLRLNRRAAQIIAISPR